MDGNRQSTPVAFGDTPASGGYVVALLRLLSPSGGGVVPKGPGEDPPAAKNRLTFNFQLFS